MRYLLPILCLFVFSCDDDDSIVGPDADATTYDICINQYDEIEVLDSTYVTLVACDSNCIEIDNDCYYNEDINVLQDIIDSNTNLTDYSPYNGSIPQTNLIGVDWNEGRITQLYLNWYNNDLELDMLPESIGNLISLERLSISNAGLDSLPQSIGNLTNLYFLYLQNNDISELPESFYNLENLEYIDLVGNNLTEISDDFLYLTNLSELWLFNNQLTSIPNLCTIPNLELYIFNNNLCEEFNYDCVIAWNTWAGNPNPQDQSNCCEGSDDLIPEDYWYNFDAYYNFVSSDSTEAHSYAENETGFSYSDWEIWTTCP